MRTVVAIQAAVPAMAEIDVADVDLVAALSVRRAQLGKALLDLEEQASRVRRDLATLTEAMKVFGYADPVPPAVPAKVARRRTREGFRRGELCRRVLEKIREAAEPVSPTEVGRAIMRDCGMDSGDQRLYFAFQHKVHNVVRRQWERGVLERLPGNDGLGARWKIAD